MEWLFLYIVKVDFDPNNLLFESCNRASVRLYWFAFIIIISGLNLKDFSE